MADTQQNSLIRLINQQPQQQMFFSLQEAADALGQSKNQQAQQSVNPLIPPQINQQQPAQNNAISPSQINNSTIPENNTFVQGLMQQKGMIDQVSPMDREGMQDYIKNMLQEIGIIDAILNGRKSGKSVMSFDLDLSDITPNINYKKHFIG